jgi:hypothetical protein
LQFFLPCGGWAFLLGFLRKNSVSLWCFCGEVVVKCVANVVSGRTLLAVEKWDTYFNFIFVWSAYRRFADWLKENF